MEGYSIRGEEIPKKMCPPELTRKAKLGKEKWGGSRKGNSSCWDLCGLRIGLKKGGKKRADGRKNGTRGISRPRPRRISTQGISRLGRPKIWDEETFANARLGAEDRRGVSGE